MPISNLGPAFLAALGLALGSGILSSSHERTLPLLDEVGVCNLIPPLTAGRSHTMTRTRPPGQDLTPNPKPPNVVRGFVAKDDDRFPSLHCTNIQVTKTRQYATWFGGTAEGAEDVKVWCVCIDRPTTTAHAQVCIAERRQRLMVEGSPSCRQARTGALEPGSLSAGPGEPPRLAHRVLQDWHGE